MKLEQGKFCPLIGKDCIGLQCSWFTEVKGYHPQTGQEIDEWECAIKDSVQGAKEGAPFIQNHIITVSQGAFDDFIDDCFIEEDEICTIGYKRCDRFNLSTSQMIVKTLTADIEI